MIRIPSYEEIVNEDDDEYEKAEEFERKFNFRYQEPDAEFVCIQIFCSLMMIIVVVKTISSNNR
jgi:hypothetical protein